MSGAGDYNNETSQELLLVPLNNHHDDDIIHANSVLQMHLNSQQTMAAKQKKLIQQSNMVLVSRDKSKHRIMRSDQQQKTLHQQAHNDLKIIYDVTQTQWQKATYDKLAGSDNRSGQLKNHSQFRYRSINQDNQSVRKIVLEEEEGNDQSTEIRPHTQQLRLKNFNGQQIQIDSRNFNYHQEARSELGRKNYIENDDQQQFQTTQTTSVAGRPIQQQFMIRRRQGSQIIRDRQSDSIHNVPLYKQIQGGKSELSRQATTNFYTQKASHSLIPNLPIGKSRMQNSLVSNTEYQQASSSVNQILKSIKNQNVIKTQMRREQYALPPVQQTTTKDHYQNSSLPLLSRGSGKPPLSQESNSAKKIEPRLRKQFQSTNQNSLELFRGSVNSSIGRVDSIRDTSMKAAALEAERKNSQFIKVQNKLEILRVANEEINRKKQLVRDLGEKYPELKITPDVIIRCQASEVQRLVQLLLFDQRIEQATKRIQSYFRTKQARKEFIDWMRRRIKAKELIVRVWKKKKWQRLCRQLVRQKQNAAAIIIQKYLQGFLSRQRFLPNLLLSRFNANMDFFDKKRQEILTDFQIKLRRVWLKYRAQKAERDRYELSIRKKIDELERARLEVHMQMAELNESCPEIDNSTLLSIKKKKNTRNANSSFSMSSVKKSLATISHSDFKKVVSQASKKAQKQSHSTVPQQQKPVNQSIQPPQQ